MKKIVISLICIICCVSLIGCNIKGKFSLEKGSSLFTTINAGNEARLMCDLVVKSNKDTKIKITAVSSVDFESGYLLSEELYGIDASNFSDVIEVKKGVNNLSVILIGEYSGVGQKADNKLPAKIYFTEVAE